MALPPFEPNETLPEDDDIISQYPAAARTFRDIMESWMLVGHDNMGLHAAVGFADLVADRPDGTADVVTVWQEAGTIYVRNDALGTLYTIPYHLYDAAALGIPNNAQAFMAEGTIKGRSFGTAGYPQNLTAAEAAAVIAAFTPDTGAAVGLKGVVAASAVGDSAAGKVFSAAGTWVNVGAPHVILEDQKAVDVQGGTFTGVTWVTRELNTEVHDPHALVTLAANKFTLPAGTYVIEWSCPAYSVNSHVSRLFNFTASTVAAAGTPEHCGTDVQTRSFGRAKVTITASTAFCIEHRGQTTKASTGLGITQLSLSPTVYTQVAIWKVG